MVSTMLSRKPSDPVPYIYSYISDLKKGVKEDKVEPITDNDMNELKNLKKKIEYYKELLGQTDEASQTESSGEDDDEVQDLQPKKKNINVQRKAVSAEVYGKFNKKEDFVPPVVQKSEETK